MASPNEIKNRGRWCPVCCKKKYVTESKCREIFELLFNKPFLNDKYNWLISPKGKWMELDGYNDNLKIAFEYNGIQHYKLHKRFHKGLISLNYIKKCDAIKEDICKQKGIILIKIPYTIMRNKLKEYIINELNLRGITQFHAT
jgi:hypothetical protein